MELFWTQADFGYVKKVVDSLAILCSPKGKIAEVGDRLINLDIRNAVEPLIIIILSY